MTERKKSRKTTMTNQTKKNDMMTERRKEIKGTNKTRNEERNEGMKKESTDEAKER